MLCLLPLCYGFYRYAVAPTVMLGWNIGEEKRTRGAAAGKSSGNVRARDTQEPSAQVPECVRMCRSVPDCVRVCDGMCESVAWEVPSPSAPTSVTSQQMRLLVLRAMTVYNLPCRDNWQRLDNRWGESPHQGG